MHFQPWLDGSHEDVYQGLLNERERVKEITGDIQIAAILDRSIIAVADVIMRCAKRREELSPQGQSPMAEIFQFKPKATLTAAQNLGVFISKCRVQLIVFGSDLNWELLFGQT